jgi:hypothetical protein
MFSDRIDGIDEVPKLHIRRQMSAPVCLGRRAASFFWLSLAWSLKLLSWRALNVAMLLNFRWWEPDDGDDWMYGPKTEEAEQ